MRQKKRLILIAVFILTIAIINLIMIKPVQAETTQTRSTDIENIDTKKYPGIKEMIQDLQKEHPNWNFKVLYTGIDWEDVIVNEYTGHGGSPRNLVPVSGNNYTGEWICESCTADKYYDNGKWRCASIKTLGYMIDARNSVNSSDVFQFMELTYQECTVDTIKPMVEGTFLDKDSYINAIIEAGEKYNVSPYYIVALAIQEQGTTGSSTISGNYSGYKGYYNIFNINATGNGSDTIIKNALTYAKKQEWTTLEKSIDGGVKKISTSYIAKGQDTLYLQKFDVDNSDGNLYWHQYQQNVMAAQNEGATLRKTFEKIKSIDSAYTFVIPVYENMPKTKCEKPVKAYTVDITNAEQVKINVTTSMNLRATPAGEIIGSLYKDEIVYRLEKATEKKNGTYWDKVMKENGTIGYVARETYDDEEQYKLYLIPIENKIETPDNPTIGTPNEGENNEENNEPEEENELISVSNEKVKVDSEAKQITIIPGTTIQEVVDLVGVAINVTDKDGNVLGKTQIPGTGCKINDKYTIIMSGDISGDGIVDARDSLRILKYSVGSYKINNEYAIAADLSKDGIIDARDSLRILKYSVGSFNIEI